MTTWVSFFLVLSIVVVVSPFLLSGSEKDPGSESGSPGEEPLLPPDLAEMKLDLSSGRLTREDFESMVERGSMDGSHERTNGKDNDPLS